MDVFFNPNTAYLLLMVGGVLAFLAVLDPGTGILELAALFTLFLTGWIGFTLAINIWALGLLLVGVLPFTLAARQTGRLAFLVVAILSLVIGSVFLFRGEGLLPAVHPVLALVGSAFTAGFYWIIMRKTLEAERARPRHDLGALIGAIGKAKTDIDDEGTVQVAGELWSAHSHSPITAETPVRVVSREGFILEVEPAQTVQEQP